MGHDTPLWFANYQDKILCYYASLLSGVWPVNIEMQGKQYTVFCDMVSDNLCDIEIT